ncbi:MAG: hypothetical protein PVJ34_06395, partial [Anaerolineae bacterium]
AASCNALGDFLVIPRPHLGRVSLFYHATIGLSKDKLNPRLGSSAIPQAQAGQELDERQKLWYIVPRNWGRGVVV